jgi:hypothetical protein
MRATITRVLTRDRLAAAMRHDLHAYVWIPADAMPQGEFDTLKYDDLIEVDELTADRRNRCTAIRARRVDRTHP